MRQLSLDLFHSHHCLHALNKPMYLPIVEVNTKDILFSNTSTSLKLGEWMSYEFETSLVCYLQVIRNVGDIFGILGVA